MSPGLIPSGDSTIQVVTCFRDLIETPLADGCNAICWRRNLEGDFEELSHKLATGEGIASIDERSFQSFDLTSAGRLAAASMQADLDRLRDVGQVPEISYVQSYPRDPDPVLATDVYSFHVDSAPQATDTFLCSYWGPGSEGLRHDQARRWVDQPQTRARLLERFGGEEGPAFAAYLSEHHFDLHYEPRPGAQSFSFGVGHLWRLAVQYPGAPVPACIHRAPDPGPNASPRLILIS